MAEGARPVKDKEYKYDHLHRARWDSGLMRLKATSLLRCAVTKRHQPRTYKAVCQPTAAGLRRASMYPPGL